MHSPLAEIELLRALLAVRAGLLHPRVLVDAWDDWRADGHQGILGDRLPSLSPAGEALLDDLAADELAARRKNPKLAIAALLREPLLGGDQPRLDTPEFRSWLRRSEGDPRNALGVVDVGQGPVKSIGQGPVKSIGQAAIEADPDALRGGRPSPVGEVQGLARLRVVRLLSKGRRSELYAAHDLDLDRPVILRVLAEGRAHDSDARADFLREAELLGRLEHPGIPPIYRLGFLLDGRPYYITCSLNAEPLGDAIERFRNPPQARGGRETLSELRTLMARFVDACKALAYAHGKGIVHAGLAADCIVIGQGGETLVVEWGQALTGVGTPSATGPREPLPEQDLLALLNFQAPEQLVVDLDRIGPAADIYAVGVLLYMTLTGRPPFEEDDPQVLRERIRAGRFLKPHRLSRRTSRALEAICLKAMSTKAEHRYSSIRLLALDLEHWRIGERVSVYREAARSRLGRTMARWPLTTLAAGALGILAAGAGVYTYDRTEILHRDRLARAEGLADALATADLREVDGLIGRLGTDRALALPRLRALADGRDSSLRIRRQATLALLADEPDRADAVIKAMLAPETSPGDFLIYRQAVLSLGLEAGLAERLWNTASLATSPLEPTGLRAAAVLAALAHRESRWAELAPRVVDALVRQPSTTEGDWATAFEPVADHLTPPLLAAYRDVERARDARDQAYRYALAFAVRPHNSTRPEDLAELLCDADPSQFREAISRIDEPGRAALHLSGKVEHPIGGDEAAERRQGQIAAALLMLRSWDNAWPLLRHSEDPTIRLEIIRRYAELGGEPGLLIDQIAELSNASDADPGVLQALFLMLGSLDPASLSSVAKEKVAGPAALLYKNHPDPGVHSAIAWLFRVPWARADWVLSLDRELIRPEPENPLRWYSHVEGLTFSVVRGPVQVQLGSPADEPGREVSETLHQVRIDRSFALSTAEISVDLFRRFLEDDRTSGITDYSRGGVAQQTVPTVDCPYLGANWYEAARFCNWLSRRDGLPTSQWCYPADVGPGTPLPENLLARMGYRLPTEAEWTYAARAGNLAPFASGLSARRLDALAWFAGNASNRAHPAGRLLPNSLGLFDASGNASEWTQTPYRPYVIDRLGASGSDVVREPNPNYTSADPNANTRVIRGGAWNDDAADLRLSTRRALAPSARGVGLGFRVARTLP